MKIIVLIAAVCFSGCSFFAVRGPGGTFEEIQDCTEDYSAPSADAFGATIFTALSAVALASGQDEPADCEYCWDLSGLSSMIGAILAVPALIYTISSVSGFSGTSQCRSAKERWRERNRTSRLIDQAIHPSSF